MVTHIFHLHSCACRCSFMMWLMGLSILYPQYVLLFQLNCMLDIMRMWMKVYRYVCTHSWICPQWSVPTSTKYKLTRIHVLLTSAILNREYGCLYGLHAYTLCLIIINNISKKGTPRTPPPLDPPLMYHIKHNCEACLPVNVSVGCSHPRRTYSEWKPPIDNPGSATVHPKIVYIISHVRTCACIWYLCGRNRAAQFPNNWCGGSQAAPISTHAALMWKWVGLLKLQRENKDSRD